MKISMDRSQKIILYTLIVIGFLAIVYLIYMGIKINKTSNKLSGTVKRELKDTNVNTLLDSDNSKIAKLIMYNNKEEVFVKDITKVEINNLESIVLRGNKISNISDYSKYSDYSVKLNDNSKANFDIQINDSYIIIAYLNEEYVIYKENDVSYLMILLDVFSNKNISNINIVEYQNYKEINLENYNSPFNLYLNSRDELKKANYSWYKKTSSSMSNVVNVNAISVKEILKNEKSIELTKIDNFVSINTQNTKLKLPKETEIKYKFYKETQNASEVEYQSSVRMIDSSYYIIPPDVSGEYILEIYMSFGNLSNNKVIYCIKCKV